MSHKEKNLFIVDGNKQNTRGLKQYLDAKFGTNVNIKTFYNGESCLSKIDSNTHLVILAYFLDGQNGNEILKAIKAINPKTEVVMLTTNDAIGVAVESFRLGATDFVIKGDTAWKKVASHVNKIVFYPVELLVNTFHISKYLAIFLMSFLGVGLVVFCAMKYISS